MLYVVLETKVLESGNRKEIQVGLCDEKFSLDDLKARIEICNAKGYDYRLIDGVDDDLKQALWEKQQRERDEGTRERDEIDDYFRDAENALEALKGIWKTKY